MSSVKQAFYKTLRQAGYSATKPRTVVFETLLADQRPYSMNELVLKTEKDIDRASLYRTVRLFEGLGIVKRITIGWKYKLELNEQFSSHHHHLHCEVCGKIIDIKEPPQLDPYIRAITSKHHFKALSHSFEVEGICESCFKKVERR